MNERLEKIKEIMGDESFVKSIVAMEDPVEVQKAFAEKGVDFSIEEINLIAQRAFRNEGEELFEEDVEDVAGGVLTEIAIVASGIGLLAGVMTEVNNSRKAAGKSTIW